MEPWETTMSTTWVPTGTTTTGTTGTTTTATTTAEATTVDHDALGWDKSCKVTGKILFQNFVSKIISQLSPMTKSAMNRVLITKTTKCGGNTRAWQLSKRRELKWTGSFTLAIGALRVSTRVPLWQRSIIGARNFRNSKSTRAVHTRGISHPVISTKRI